MSTFNQLEQDFGRFLAVALSPKMPHLPKRSKKYTWQRQRIHTTHQALFGVAENQAMGLFFD